MCFQVVLPSAQRVMLKAPTNATPLGIATPVTPWTPAPRNARVRLWAVQPLALIVVVVVAFVIVMIADTAAPLPNSNTLNYGLP